MMKLHNLAMPFLVLAACSAQNGPSSSTGGGSGGSGGSDSGGRSGGGSGGKGSAGSGGGAAGKSTATGGEWGSGGSSTQTGGKPGTGGTTVTGSGGAAGSTGSGGTTGSSSDVDGGGLGGVGSCPSAGGAPGGPSTLPWLKVVGPQLQREDNCKQVILRGVSMQGIGTRDMTKDIDYVTNTADTQGTSPGWYPKLIRLPVDTNGDPSGQINTVLKTSVEYCTKKGLYCIIDLHYVDNPYQNKAAVDRFWTTVAPIYKDYSNVIYEVFNESKVQDSWATYKPTMQGWVDLIRKYAPKNIIYAGSPSWDQTLGDIADNPLTGENIVYVVHMYEEHFVDPKNGFKPYPGPNSIQANVEKCGKKHPLAMTEWGFNHETSQPGINTDIIGHYGKPILEWLEGMGASWTAWCASDSWLPRMFTGEGGRWVLRTGQDNMGGFVKDWLYTHKDDKAPF